MIAGLGLAGALLPLTWWFLSTTFMVYDDEGYVLWTLRDVAGGRALYSEVFSQYGPFPYVLHTLLGWIGYPFTSDAVRLSAGICWLGTAGFTGLITRRLTGSLTLGCTAVLLAWVALADMRYEPGHPGGMLALLLALAAWLGTSQILREQWSAFGGWQAGIGAVMLLSKINVGVFHFIAALAWWPFRHPPRLRPVLRQVILAVFAAVTAAILMGGLLHTRPVQIQYVNFLVIMLPLVLLLPRPADSATSLVPLRMGLASAGAMTVATAAFILAQGTAWHDLWWFGVLAPLRHPAAFHLSVSWQSAALAVSAASLAGALAWLMSPARGRRWILVSLKLTGVLVLTCACWRAEMDRVETALFQYLAPLAWALALPLTTAGGKLMRARWWLAWLSGWHWLQAYPVAGTQMAWGSFLAVPLVLIAWGDLLDALRWRRAGCTVALLLALLATGKLGQIAWNFRANSAAPDLPGAHSLRLEPRFASTLRTVAVNARANATMLFTYPGMLSLNLWTDVPPPTHANTTHWFSLLNEEQQHAIRDRLEQTRDSLVVVQREHVQYLIQMGLGPTGLLKDYLQASYRPVLRIDGYDIWSRQPERFVPQSVARALEVSGRVTVVMWTRAPLAEVATIVVNDLAQPTPPIRLQLTGAAWAPAEWPGHSGAADRPGQRYCWWPAPESDWVRWPAVELHLLDRAGNELDRLRLEHSPLIAPAFTDALPPPTD